QPANHFQRCFGRKQRVVLARGEGSPIGQDSIADELIDDAVIFEDDFSHGGQVFVQQSNKFHGVRLLGEGGEVAHVGKKDGQFAPLSCQVDLLQMVEHVVDELRRNVAVEGATSPA